MKAPASIESSHDKQVADPPCATAGLPGDRGLKYRLSQPAFAEPGIGILLFFGVIWLLIQPSLQYYSWEPVFLFTNRFFREHLAYPGGLADYGGAFLLQLYRYSWLGALVTTALGAGLFLATRGLLKAVGLERAWVLPWLGPILLLMSQGDYQYQFVAPVLALTVSLGFAAAYVSLPVGNPVLRLVIFLVGSVLVYYVSCGTYLVGAAAVIMVGTAMRRPVWEISAQFVIAAVTPFFAPDVFIITRKDAYAFLLPWGDAMPQPAHFPRALFVLVPVLLGGVLVWKRLVVRGGNAQRTEVDLEQSRLKAHSERHAADLKAKASRHAGRSHSHPVMKFAWATHPLLWFVLLGAGGIAWSFQPQARLAARIDAYAQRNKWAGVLEDAANTHVATSATILDINRALAHSGRLLDDMFSYPQREGWGFWFDVGPAVDLNKVLKGSDLLWELGHVNRAQRMAGEALEMTGYRPATLQRMFLINVIKGEPETGLPFLNLLSRTMWHCGWAGHYKQTLQLDPTLLNDPELRSIRKVMIASDYVGALPENVILQSCLRQDPANRMAFDLLMGYYLLDRNVTKVCQNLDRLDAVGLNRLPRHLEEAVLLSRQLNPTNEVRLFGRTISPETVERHREFIREAGQLRSDRPELQATLASRFGNTFWFYYLYGRSGSFTPGKTPKGK